REVFKGQPWMEVFDYSRESDGLREKNVRDIVAGDAFFLAGRYKEAKKHYYRAADNDYPAHVVADVYRRLADAQFRLGTYYDARRSYRRAERAAPDSAVIKKGIAACDEMIRRKDGEKPTAGAVTAPAAHTVSTVADRTNDVDQIIKTLEDPATVREQVDRDRLQIERRGQMARGETVAVSGNEKAGEEKQAAAEETPAEVEEEPTPPTVEEPEPLPEQPEEEVVEEPVEEVTEEPAEEATEQPAEEATEEPAADATEQPAEEDIEEPVEEETGTEEPAEEVVETETTEEEPAPEAVEEESDVEMAEADAEESTAEPVVEEGMEQAPTDVVEGGAPETDIADDDQPIVFEADSGKGEQEEVIAPVPALVTEEEQEQTAEMVPVADLSVQLPRLPFFGCENVTDEQLRLIIQEIRSNPGG
ncbi:MAG: tetratricopeptide repeat protein, partial [Planctomycetota bacterium]